jgi:hypothetical protein
MYIFKVNEISPGPSFSKRGRKHSPRPSFFKEWNRGFPPLKKGTKGDFLDA